MKDLTPLYGVNILDQSHQKSSLENNNSQQNTYIRLPITKPNNTCEIIIMDSDKMKLVICIRSASNINGYKRVVVMVYTIKLMASMDFCLNIE